MSQSVNAPSAEIIRLNGTSLPVDRLKDPAKHAFVSEVGSFREIGRGGWVRSADFAWLAGFVLRDRAGLLGSFFRFGSLDTRIPSILTSFQE
jgi:hypothetical protein